jgi:hypothetical protein
LKHCFPNNHARFGGKLGADMTDDEIKSLAKQHYAMYDHWQIDLVAFARALLARQPAAIDRQEAERYRWLRDRSNDIEWPIGAGWGELGEAEGQEFDAIVDNAMRASNGT